MSVSNNGEVLSPLEFKIRALELKAEEIRAILNILLQTLGLTVVRSVQDPNQLMVLGSPDRGAAGEITSTQSPPCKGGS